MATTQCYKCGNSLTIASGVSRTATCPECDSDVRVCLNCEYYDPGRQYDCRERIVDPVFDKERANFCDYFRPGKGSVSNSASSDAARSAFNNLFNDD